MSFPFLGDGREEPCGADGITGLAAQTALRTMNDLGRELTGGLDLTEELPPGESYEKVRRLAEEEWADPRRRRPPAGGVPSRDECWDSHAQQAMRRVTEAVRAELETVANVSGQPVTVLGASGTLAQRTSVFRHHIRANLPVVSVSASGCMRRWLATRDPAATSLSILAYLPNRPLYAAMVTADTALLSDCSGSWRLTLADGWQAMSGEPLIADPAPGYVVLPRALERLGPRLRKHYREPLFPYDTSSKIVQAVLGGAVPVAVHFTEHVLDSAILPVAIGHGMVVRLADGGLLEKPWEASKHLYKAVTGQLSIGPELVIARDLWEARRVSRVLAKEMRLLTQSHPLDNPYDIDPDGDDDLFGFRFDDH